MQDEVSDVYIKGMQWGYDEGAAKGKEGDGYLNIEIQLQDGEDPYYIWMSRSWDYEKVVIAGESMFSIAMHMTHFDADFDLEYQYVENHAIEDYVYPPLEFPENQLKKSRFYPGIQFCREALNYYPELSLEQKKKLETKVGFEFGNV